jgi:hypothetical protein
MHPSQVRQAIAWLHRFLQAFDVVVIPFDGDHWQEAVAAYNLYGRGRHPAALNLGDCFSYATAKLAGQPLLCLGDDFRQTDLPIAWHTARGEDRGRGRRRLRLRWRAATDRGGRGCDKRHSLSVKYVTARRVLFW